MKSIEEITDMLGLELHKHIGKIKSINYKSDYYNDILGDTSFLLAALLESALQRNHNDWDRNNWIDDSLITNVWIQNNDLKICGVMIWGKENSTEQWTDPFCFEIQLSEDNSIFKKFTLLFRDLDMSEITYAEFRNNRDYWSIATRNWRYTLTQNLEHN